MNKHLSTFPSICRFQSAYRKFHSTETALLRIYNDILLAANYQKVTALVLLDLSAAFDTIDHSILLSRLQFTYGLDGNALSIISSYLSNRFQRVIIDNNPSDPLPLTTGVPQGSVLGPLLFTLYTSPISEIFTGSNISFHLYADDTQLYIPFSSSDSITALNTLSASLDAVYSWLTFNRLSVNPDKTEFLLIGTPQQCSKITHTSLIFRGKLLSSSAHARNLGVELDSHLTFDNHISNICRSSYFQIRQLRQIRSSITQSAAIQLANALVSSKLDYCNSLLYHLPEASLYRLQRIQNSLARIVIPSTKFCDHITLVLKKLHWLPIKQRIKFKIGVTTFKTLNTLQPSYLTELLNLRKPRRSLRSSSDEHLLDIPLIKSKLGSRSFSCAAPEIWNSLPQDLRKTNNLSYFTSHLKSTLFDEAFT